VTPSAEDHRGPVGAGFGAHALPRPLEELRRLGAGLGPGWAGRRVASAIRRVCLLAHAGPVDVEPFPGQRARLYPRDNLSEKRVFGAAATWDRRERAALAAWMRACEPPFHFVDAGANAGLYTLALRAAGPVRGVAIEPDPVMLSRLRFNLEVSGAAAEVTVAPVALAAEAGTVRLGRADGNRGETAMRQDDGAETGEGDIRVAAKPLHAVVQEAGLPRIDALKIDIEGAEAEVLAAFFAEAQQAIWPGLVVIEARRGAETPALALLREAGYVERERTRLNAILAGPGAALRASGDMGKANGQARLL